MISSITVRTHILIFLFFLADVMIWEIFNQPYGSLVMSSTIVWFIQPRLSHFLLIPIILITLESLIKYDHIGLIWLSILPAWVCLIGLRYIMFYRVWLPLIPSFIAGILEIYGIKAWYFNKKVTTLKGYAFWQIFVIIITTLMISLIWHRRGNTGNRSFIVE